MPHFLGVVDMKYIINEIYEYHKIMYGFKVGMICNVYRTDEDNIYLINPENGKTAHFYKVMLSIHTNRDVLRDFLKLNNIKKTLVSKALGKSENWLTQMANDKRRDMTEETLQRILKMLHIDWSSDKTLHVKTKGYVPYTTKPCTYHTDMHKERLQKAFWNGEVTL